MGVVGSCWPSHRAVGELQIARVVELGWIFPAKEGDSPVDEIRATLFMTPE